MGAGNGIAKEKKMRSHWSMYTDDDILEPFAEAKDGFILWITLCGYDVGDIGPNEVWPENTKVCPRHEEADLLFFHAVSKMIIEQVRQRGLSDPHIDRMCRQLALTICPMDQWPDSVWHYLVSGREPETAAIQVEQDADIMIGMHGYWYSYHVWVTTSGYWSGPEMLDHFLWYVWSWADKHTAYHEIWSKRKRREQALELSLQIAGR